MLKQNDSWSKILLLGGGKIFLILSCQFIILIGLLYGVTFFINAIFGVTLSTLQVAWYSLMGICLLLLCSFTLTLVTAIIGYIISLFMYNTNLIDFQTNDSTKKHGT